MTQVAIAQWYARWVCSLSVAVYALSFFLPSFAVVVEGKHSIFYGYDAFLIGFLSPFSSPFFGGLRTFVPWLANPMLWVGLFLFARTRYAKASAAGVTATAMSVTLLFGDAEGPDLILIGYYVWAMSMVLMTLAAGMRWVKHLALWLRRA